MGTAWLLGFATIPLAGACGGEIASGGMLNTTGPRMAP
jgi:hypothetical protein